MTTAQQEAHLPALDEHRRSEAGHELQATLVELVDSWRELSDTVAERAVAIGVAPTGAPEPSRPARASTPSTPGRSTPTRRRTSSSPASRT
jgi:hypothetical protein